MAVVDPDLEERGWWDEGEPVLFKRVTMEEHACEFREILTDDQESFSAALQFQLFPSSYTEENTMLKLR